MEKVEADTNLLSIDEFTTKYTSEDDASFSKLLDQQVQDAKKTHYWVSRSRDLHNRLLEQANKGQSIEMWKNFSVKNPLLTFPDSLNPVYSAQDFSKDDKKVIAINSRFPPGPIWNDKNKQASYSSKDEPNFCESGESQLYRQISENQKFQTTDSQQDLPEISGYKFVQIPSINPDNIPQSPFITWGDIGEPVSLEKASKNNPKPTSGFSIPETPKRQQIANKLVKKSSLDSKKRQKPSTPLLIHNTPRLNYGLNSVPSSPLLNFDPQLRASYSPLIKIHGMKNNSTNSTTSTPRNLNTNKM